MKATRFVGKLVVVAVMAAAVQVGANATAAAAPATPATLAVAGAAAPVLVTPQPLRATGMVWHADGSLTVLAAQPAAGVAEVQPHISFSYTFSRESTQRIYQYALLGVVAVERYCSTLPWPSWVLSACSYVASLVVGYMLGNPPNGRCLRVTLSIGWPPVPRGSLRYVTCPLAATAMNRPVLATA